MPVQSQDCRVLITFYVVSSPMPKVPVPNENSIVTSSLDIPFTLFPPPTQINFVDFMACSYVMYFKKKMRVICFTHTAFPRYGAELHTLHLASKNIFWCPLSIVAAYVDCKREREGERKISFPFIKHQFPVEVGK